MPHSHFPSWNPCWTQRNQVTNMPSTRSGWQYSTRTPMPSSSTLRQGSSPSSSSSSSSSILRGLPPYRWREWIPDITLLEYGRILSNDDDHDDLIAILYPQSNLYSRTITMWHLWITAQKLRKEADRQEIEARRLFIEMEGTGLQQVLHPHQITPPQQFPSAAAWPPTPYYPAQEEIQPLEPVEQSPTPPPTSPPLGEQGNPIIVEDSDEELDRRDDNFYMAESTFFTPVSFLLHCQECTDRRHQYFKCPQYICDHCYWWAPGHRVSDCLGVWSQWLQP